MLMDGKEVSNNICKTLEAKIKALHIQDIIPTLAVVLIGNSEASVIYIKNKKKFCEKLNVSLEEFHLDESANFEEIKLLINDLNKRDDINGIIVQTPLPKHLNTQEVLDLVCPKKDVDALTSKNKANFYLGKKCVVPCTPLGILELFKHYQIPLESKNIVIINRSDLVGLPLSNLLLKENATITICHSKTKNLKTITTNADIIISAVGKEKFITVDMVSDKAIVIDVGITYQNGKIYGDVDFDNVSKKCSFITPVPGGVGPMTVTMLISNLIDLCQEQNIETDLF